MSLSISAPPTQPKEYPCLEKSSHSYDEKQTLEQLEQSTINLEEDFSNSSIEEVRVTISTIISFVNQFFYLRQTSVSISYPIVALLSLPLGHFLAKVLPTRQFKIPFPTFRGMGAFKFTLNPGPFTLKEHVLIGTMAACNTNTAYAVDIIILQKLFYHDEKSAIGGFLLVLTTQITGFAIAGAVRRFLVRPAHMVWPSTLVAASLYRSLHAQSSIDEKEKEGADKGRMPRMKYFLLLTFATFIYYWFPGFIFPTIGTISWICWIKPNNPVLAQLTGSAGLGIGTIALDWSAVNYYISPLVTPWFAQLNILAGFVVLVYILVPLTYYTNLWNSKNYPIVTADLFLENGSPYNISAVLGPTGVLDEDLYEAYGPVRMSSFLALAYGVGFAGLAATVVHTVLYHGKEMLVRFKSTMIDQADVHSRLMFAYPEVPDWWYGVLFVLMFILSLYTCISDNLMPWWALVLAILMAVFFVLPVGIVQATTNLQPGLNIVTEYVIGLLLPGHAISNVTFKTYGYIVNAQALQFASDLKLGHYMKIPPQIMFMVQLVSCIIASVINLQTALWLINTQPHICTQEGYPFTCRSTKTFYSASVIWGAIGPTRVFGAHNGIMYSSIQWGFLIGVLLPLIFWMASKKYPNKSWLRKVHWPVLLTSTSNIPPALPYFYSNGLFVGFIFAYWLRRYRFDWWSRYNYLTNAALNTGVALSGLIIFFGLQYWGVKMPYWWGNPDTTGNTQESLDHCYKASLSLSFNNA
ncbi:hypothetical protein BGZ76_008907 [Entomortierella beljakovae]|nr:hypothetical protein BGZ76_008907 [Entomortierella beljakovae]